MTITDIDKQFDEKWYTLHDAGGFEVSEKVREFIHQIYSQAKAEQREEDAKVAEGKNKYWHIRFEGINDVDESARRKEFNKEVTLLINSVVDDIASEIRGQHECKQTTQVSLQVKE